ncbi:hypothetical protein LINPERPRIM_LOCUS10003 [Linum perenne]
MRWDRLILETDCQRVQHDINGERRDRTEYGRIIGACQDLLRVQPHVKVSFVRREGNKAAHTIARRSINPVDPSTGETAPDWLCDSLFDLFDDLMKDELSFKKKNTLLAADFAIYVYNIIITSRHIIIPS